VHFALQHDAQQFHEGDNQFVSPSGKMLLLLFCSFDASFSTHSYFMPSQRLQDRAALPSRRDLLQNFCLATAPIARAFVYTQLAAWPTLLHVQPATACHHSHSELLTCWLHHHPASLCHPSGLCFAVVQGARWGLWERLPEL